MMRPGILILAGLASLAAVAGHDYRAIFGDDYELALAKMDEFRPSFERLCGLYQADTAVVASMVFPELLRYSELRNYFETAGLELVYNSLGSDYGDFSVGVFQMKPSFAERLEARVMADTALAASLGGKMAYAQRRPELVRAERVRRLQQIDWQVFYALSLCLLLDRTHAGLAFADKSQKIRFYATAYNHGFESPAQEILDWQDRRFFPNGGSLIYEQYAFSDVSRYFYQEDFHAIFGP